MKLEVGKFYRTRDGRKVLIENRDRAFVDSPLPFKFSLKPTKECSTYLAICDENGKNPFNSELDLIEEWKEPEVKEPKFKVGDRVRPNKEEWRKTHFSGNRMVEHWNQCWYHEGPVPTDSIFFVVGFANGKVKYSNKPNGNGPYVASKFLELVEPEITVNSRWTNIGKESKIVTVVYINDKYVTFEHDGRGTIETTTHDTFYVAYKPYVDPPKSLVGYVGVVKATNGRFVFTDVYESEEDLRYDWEGYDVVSVKEIEWTEGE